MEKEEVEFYVNWIIADFIPFQFNNRYYSIRSPSREAKVIADEIFLEYYYKAINNNILDSDGVYKLLTDRGIWNEEKENLVNKMNEEIEEMKVVVFNSYLDVGIRRKVKRAIYDTKVQLEKFSKQKQTFDYLGADFVANYAKYQILLGYSIYYGKRPLWKSMKRWDMPDEMASIINNKAGKYKLNPDNYRELAVSDYWRSIYNIKRGNLFGKAVVDYTDSQKNLLGWSQAYENIYKSPDCPPDEIIEDFDAIDGWFIVQRRKRESELNNRTIQGGLNEKVKNSEHVFIIRQDDDKGDAKDFTRKVYSLNDAGGKIALHKRLNQINKQGIVKEVNMLDTRQLLQEKAFELRSK